MEQVIKNSLVCVGIFLLFQPGNLLYFIRARLKKILPLVLLKPLFECLSCMASIWGITYWLIEVYPTMPIVSPLVYLKSLCLHLLQVLALNFIFDCAIVLMGNRHLQPKKQILL